MAVIEENKSAEYLDMEGLQLYDTLIKAKITTDLNANKYDDTALKAKVTANETAITALNGEGEGSVKKQVNDAVAKIIADAPEAYDTLKEISDWISSHANDASAMNSQINTNRTDIASLRTLIGTLPENAASMSIVDYIAEAIGVSQDDLTSKIATAKAEAIATAATDATTKANKSLVDAKEYADGLAENYEKAGAVKELADGQVATNKSDILKLKTKVDTLGNATPITETEINSLFGITK